jgi:1-phosphofructokinase
VAIVEGTGVGGALARGVCVFAPAPILTLTLERSADGDEELHVHAGGQGYWVGRMAGLLGADVELCAPLGGETGDVLEHLLEEDRVTLRVVRVRQASGSYIHDRRGDEREEWWHAPLGTLTRHEVDDLYTATLAASLELGLCLLTGTHRQETVLPESTYTRLASDLHANEVDVVCDLQGELLRAALEGGVDLVKISHEELIEDGWAAGDGTDELVRGMERLREAGAGDVVVSRASGGALALLGESLLEARAPEMTAVEPSGAGDSMTAALAFGRTRGLGAHELLRLGVAAGAVNVTRHGLGTGDAEAIQLLAEHVEISDARMGAA